MVLDSDNMKIAYLANVRIPSERAHATQIVHMCQAFAEMGNEVHLFASSRAKGGKSEIDNQYKINSLFTLHRVGYGVFNPKIRITFYLSELYFTLSFLLRRKTFDVYFTRSEWIAWFLSFFISNKKIIWESHEAKKNFPAKMILKKGIKLVAISEGVANEYRDLTDKILVAHDGIDDSFFNVIESKSVARDRLGLPQDVMIAMYIGGLEKWKGIETFCEAAGRENNIKFVVIGGNQEQIKNLKDRYKDVVFLGSQPYSDLPNNQQAADILVIPSTATEKLSSLYTSPLKLFAHMTSGVPLLVSGVPSLEVVVSESQVTFFEADNAQSLVEGVDEIRQEYSKKLEIAKDLQVFSKKYLWTERAKQIKNFISENNI